MDVAGWALIISIAALIVATGSAWYTRSQAVSTRRSVDLEHEAYLELRIGRTARVVVPGRKAPPAQPTIELHNVGNGSALSVKVKPQTPPVSVSSKDFRVIEPKQNVGLGNAVNFKGQIVTLKVVWKTPDGKPRKKDLSVQVPD